MWDISCWRWCLLDSFYWYLKTKKSSEILIQRNYRIYPLRVTPLVLYTGYRQQMVVLGGRDCREFAPPIYWLKEFNQNMTSWYEKIYRRQGNGWKSQKSTWNLKWILLSCNLKNKRGWMKVWVWKAQTSSPLRLEISAFQSTGVLEDYKKIWILQVFDNSGTKSGNINYFPMWMLFIVD